MERLQKEFLPRTFFPVQYLQPPFAKEHIFQEVLSYLKGELLFFYRRLLQQFKWFG